jgi:hypothetical protein
MNDSPSDITFGNQHTETWSLRPYSGSYENPPSPKILRSPVGAVLALNGTILNGFPFFENIGSNLFDQLGIAEQASESERVIDEVILYNSKEWPNTYILNGSNNTKIEYNLTKEQYLTNISGFDIYTGTEESKGLMIALGNNIVVITTQPLPQREYTVDFLNSLTDSGDHPGNSEAFSRGFNQLNKAPVVTGEINGGRMGLDQIGYGERGIDELTEMDTLLYAFNTDGSTGRVQFVGINDRKSVPNEHSLKSVFYRGKGEYIYKSDERIAQVHAVFD